MIEILKRIRAHARRDAQAVAIVRRESDGSYTEATYGQLAAEVDAFAQAFARHARGARLVPILAGKSATTAAALLGAGVSGYAAACLNPKLRGPQLERILAAGRARLAVLDGAGLLALQGTDSDAPWLNRVRWWLVRGPSFMPIHERAADAMRHRPGLQCWPITPEPVALPDIAPTAPAVCLFTSGSTGTPKGVLVGNRDLLHRAEAEIECFGLTERDVLLSVLPFSFDVGLNQLIASLVAGATLVILDSWMPTDILRAVEERRVTGISAVPSIWLDFLKTASRFRLEDAHRSLRYITVSGGDLKSPHLEALPGLGGGLQVFKTYGQTEAFRPTCLLPAEFADHGRSVGRPVRGSRVYVVRDDGSLAASGEQGEVVATGLGVMLGYLDGDDDQRKLRSNPFRGPEDAAAKAVYTGDVGYLDEAGYLHLLGRRDSMLKIMGNRVYPGEVAAQLLSLPGVHQAEVVGVACGDGGIRLYAFVVVDPDAPPADELRRLMTSRVPAYMVPAAVFTLEAMPRTASGKPDYQALVTEAKAVS